MRTIELHEEIVEAIREKERAYQHVQIAREQLRDLERDLQKAEEHVAQLRDALWMAFREEAGLGRVDTKQVAYELVKGLPHV